MPHAGKQEHHVARRHLPLPGRLGFKDSFAAGDVENLKLGQGATTLGNKLIEIGMHATGVGTSGRHARTARPGDVHVPLHVPLAHGEVSEEFFGQNRHRTPRQGLLMPQA